MVRRPNPHSCNFLPKPRLAERPKLVRSQPGQAFRSRNLIRRLSSRCEKSWVVIVATRPMVGPTVNHKSPRKTRRIVTLALAGASYFLAEFSLRGGLVRRLWGKG